MSALLKWCTSFVILTCHTVVKIVIKKIANINMNYQRYKRDIEHASLTLS
jgi:hypothetical protein